MFIFFQALAVLPNEQQKRNLSIHEHLSWELLTNAGVKVPKFKVTESIAEVRKLAEEIGTVKLATEHKIKGNDYYMEASNLLKMFEIIYAFIEK